MKQLSSLEARVIAELIEQLAWHGQRQCQCCGSVERGKTNASFAHSVTCPVREAVQCLSGDQ